MSEVGPVTRITIGEACGMLVDAALDSSTFKRVARAGGAVSNRDGAAFAVFVVRLDIGKSYADALREAADALEAAHGRAGEDDAEIALEHWRSTVKA